MAISKKIGTEDDSSIRVPVVSLGAAVLASEITDTTGQSAPSDVFTLVADQLADLTHDDPDKRRNAIFGLSRNMAGVDPSRHAQLVGLVGPALSHDEWQIEEVGIEALGAMLVYLQGDIHFTVCGRLLSVVKKEDDWRLVKQALHSLMSARFDSMDIYDRHSAIDLVTDKVGDPFSEDVRDEARSLIKKSVFRLPSANQYQIFKKAEMMSASDAWPVRYSVARLIREVFIDEAPIGMHPIDVHDLLGSTLHDSNWKVLQTSLQTVADKAQQLAGNRHIVKKIADACLSEKTQVAQAARKALKEIVLRASPAMQTFVIEHLEKSFVGNPSDKRQKIVSTIARMFKIVSRANQHHVVRAIIGFYGDPDLGVSEAIRESLMTIVDSIHESQPWQGARLVLLMKKSSQNGARFLSDDILEGIPMDSPINMPLAARNHSDKLVKKAVRKFLEPAYAEVTEKNEDVVIGLLEMLLVFNGKIQDAGLAAAKETAPFMKTASQQKKMVDMIDRVAHKTGTGRVYHTHALTHMPQLSDAAMSEVRHASPSSFKRIGQALRKLGGMK